MIKLKKLFYNFKNMRDVLKKDIIYIISSLIFTFYSLYFSERIYIAYLDIFLILLNIFLFYKFLYDLLFENFLKMQIINWLIVLLLIFLSFNEIDFAILLILFSFFIFPLFSIFYEKYIGLWYIFSLIFMFISWCFIIFLDGIYVFLVIFCWVFPVFIVPILIWIKKYIKTKKSQVFK